MEKEQPDYLCAPLWPVRLGVRTPGFHPGSRGSNPLRATKKDLNGSFFIVKDFETELRERGEVDNKRIGKSFVHFRLGFCCIFCL